MCSNSRTIGVQLTNEAAQITVFEIYRENVTSELHGSPDDEAENKENHQSVRPGAACKNVLQQHWK
jgi:hypothetical protein